MLIDAVILVLREVLEAAVMISAMIALGRYQRQGLAWLLCALPLALGGIVIYAGNLDLITDSFDGAGQEVINAALQIAAFVLVTLAIYFFGRPRATRTGFSPAAAMMTLAVATAMVREGSEIWIYVSGFAGIAQYRSAVFYGAAIGAIIGCSVCILLYAFIMSQSFRRGAASALLLLALTSAGMVLQASLLLEQVDYLPTLAPLWDSSRLVSEESIPGVILYAVFGYEATPNGIELLLYLGALTLVLVTAGDTLRRTGSEM
ncbi:FTR1 family protein [Haliea sp. E17]|uniref:FTR1 family protein n=1 Tax=Haliea sp. E17 TaxID=3401576 RepID=UPI003AAF1BA7